MSKKNASGRRIAATLLAIALSACGSIQGASPARAGLPAGAPSGSSQLLEFDSNDTATEMPHEAGLLGGEYPPAPAVQNATGFGSMNGESAGGAYLVP